MARVFESAEALTEALIANVGKRLVVGLPVGIGKAIHIADALFARAMRDDSISLTFFTGLTLETPKGASELERRFLDSLVKRLYADWPSPAYADALRRQTLPANIRIREFYLRPGAWLGNPLAQQSYTSINYSHVVAELEKLGINVIAQLISARDPGSGRHSLSCNPEITLDLLPVFEARRKNGESVALVGQVNDHLPYMRGDAAIDADRFDFVLETDKPHHPLFSLPNRPVSAADYATAMHVASLVRDGGTVQIGIGSLSDAVAHCLRLRHENPQLFRQVLELLPGGTRSARRSVLPVETGPFEQGLFASTELLSDALFSLFQAGIIKRAADQEDDAVIHAGFFIGSAKFYERLNALGDSERRRIRMTRISHVNTLFGDEARKRRQRRHCRFVNETMIVTLLGAAASDGLDDGRVVSGVGGQFDFVSMALALEDAQSILMCRARRLHDGVASSNIRWSYEHATVPRHFRDVVVSEYGIAATRGLGDRDVIDAMLGIADSDFQPRLIAAAKKAGKLEKDYQLPGEHRANEPKILRQIFARDDLHAYFPRYPLGTDFTDSEQELIAALEWLDERTARFWPKLKLYSDALLRSGNGYSDAVARMGLERPSGLRQKLLRRALGVALEETGK
ncbi:MAG: acetyl-CoA hydrolase/transferase C-terminal domain-containing protein [Woeseiaceae bacterium]|nr:acetyl-CoA hydrolase/transferase C-terminal domain-containing protein [Woeseiaceae bacterium]